MSATRLLVLGAVRIFQPVHGYLVRRELLSWNVEAWANVNPGSIYNALRTLTRDGCLEETGTEVEGARPARTTYALTLDGENEYAGLLRQSLWFPDPKDPAFLLAGLSFLTTLTREEFVEALDARESALRVNVTGLDRTIISMGETRTVPAHTYESFAVSRAWVLGELAWVAEARERVRDGQYVFRGEPGAERGPVDGRWPGPLDKLGDIPPDGDVAPG